MGINQDNANKITQTFTFSIIDFSGKTIATNLSKVISTYEAQNRTYLRYCPEIRSQLTITDVAQGSLMKVVGVSIPSLAYSGQLKTGPRRSDTAMFTM